ncbi:MAG: response regulator, partial [Acidobacteria bacterium]|nr:response regulator [Acidobacteriota bacterium]
MKFTTRGEVVLRAELVQDGEQNVVVRFEVRDTGVGIGPEAQARLFKPFSQADASMTRRFGGTGLGLAISRQLVELMDGHIGVESEEGKGSRFWFTARLGRAADPELSTATPRADLRGIRLLAVDDNATNLEVIQGQASSWGVHCDTVLDPERAFDILWHAKAEGRPYDVIITDMQMPKLDGLSLARLVRDHPGFGKLPIILMTSAGLRAHVEASRQVGISAYLTKPVRQSTLFDCLATVMSHSESHQQQAAVKAPPLITSDKLRELRAQDRARILLAEDNETNQIVAVQMLEKLGYRVDVASNGVQA